MEHNDVITLEDCISRHTTEEIFGTLTHCIALLNMFPFCKAHRNNFKPSSIIVVKNARSNSFPVMTIDLADYRLFEHQSKFGVQDFFIVYRHERGFVKRLRQYILLDQRAWHNALVTSQCMNRFDHYLNAA